MSIKENEVLAVKHQDGVPYLQLNKIVGLRVSYKGTIYLTVELKGELVTISLKPGENIYRETYRVLGGNFI